MSGPLLFGVFIGALLSSVLLHWMYQTSAAKHEKRWRAETHRLRAEIARLRLTDAEREAVWSAIEYGEDTAVSGLPPLWASALRNLLARLGGGK